VANNDGRKISGYSACNVPEANALLVVVGNTAGTKNTFTLSLTTLLGNNAANVYVANTKTLSANNLVIRKKSTPITSGDTVGEGSIWWDATYLYIAVANNVIKRVALETF